MSDHKGDPAKKPTDCTSHTNCPHIKCTYEGMDSETWSCPLCGEHFKLYYDEMA
jgi:hypothetical protein